MIITEKTLTLDSLFGFPKVEGKIIPNNLSDITNDIISRREEIFPGCTTTENYDFIKNDWNGYHSYVCMEKFPELKFLFPIIAESLELLGDSYKEYYFKSWVNMWPRKQSINAHRHYGEWHGYYVIRDTGTTTCYADSDDRETRQIVPLTNYDGRFVMLPAHVLHWAKKNPVNEWRVSMGFNLSTWDQILIEEKGNDCKRGDKLRNVILPLKEYI